MSNALQIPFCMSAYLMLPISCVLTGMESPGWQCSGSGIPLESAHNWHVHHVLLGLPRERRGSGRSCCSCFGASQPGCFCRSLGRVPELPARVPAGTIPFHVSCFTTVPPRAAAGASLRGFLLYCDVLTSHHMSLLVPTSVFLPVWCCTFNDLIDRRQVRKSVCFAVHLHCRHFTAVERLCTALCRV